MFLLKEKVIFVHEFKMADRTWRRFDKTSNVFHVFRYFSFLISLITHESYRNECYDYYLVPICPRTVTNSIWCKFFPMENIFVWLKDYRALLVCLSINIFLYSHNKTFFSFSNFSTTSTFQRNKKMFLLLKTFCHLQIHFGTIWHSANLPINN